MSLREFFNFLLKLSGGYGEEVTPVPIPNTAVKLFSVDGNWGIPPVRVEHRRAVFFERCVYNLQMLFYGVVLKILDQMNGILRKPARCEIEEAVHEVTQVVGSL